MKQAVRLGLAAAAIAVLGAACGTSGAETGKAGDKKKKHDPARWREFGMTDQEYTDAIQRVQSLIAECMSKAGFRYIPATVEMIQHAQDSVRLEPPKYTRVEYKKRWGYGATTRFDNKVKQIELGEQNLQIYENLSDADKEAYDRTMWGEDPDQTFAWSFDEEDFTGTGGCTRAAVEQVFTKEQISGTYVNPKDVAVSNDPRVIKAEEAWVKCMEAAGYEGYEDQDEIIEELEKRLDELVGDADPEELTGPKLQQLKELQQWEIKASLADVDCQIKHTDAVYRQVEIEIFGRPVSGTLRS